MTQSSWLSPRGPGSARTPTAPVQPGGPGGAAARCSIAPGGLRQILDVGALCGGAAPVGGGQGKLQHGEGGGVVALLLCLADSVLCSSLQVGFVPIT